MKRWQEETLKNDNYYEVYEYYGNGTLEDKGKCTLSFIKDVVIPNMNEGLHFLHTIEGRGIVHGDIKEASSIFGSASFDVITTNPPYMIGQHGIANASDTKAIARHEVLCTLDDILRESAKILRPGGRFYMVHRPFRLAEIMSKMVQVGIEPKRMRMVHPFVDKEPNMVLIEGLKGGNSRITVEPPLIVYDAPGVYTEELKRMYYEV